MRIVLLVAALLMAGHGANHAASVPAEPDFYLVMQKCSTTVGYLVLSDESLKTMDGTPVTNVCTRHGKSVTCELVFQDGASGHKGNTATYTVTIDSPPMLLFADEKSGDWFMVDTAKHAAVLITRVVDAQFAGAKVCHGMFATQSEIEILREKN